MLTVEEEKMWLCKEAGQGQVERHRPEEHQVGSKTKGSPTSKEKVG